MPPNMQTVLSQLLLADVSHRSFLTKQQLAYHVMQLPVVRRTFANVGEATSRKFLSRDVNSGHWLLKRRTKRRHIRFSTVLYIDLPGFYEPVEFGDSTPQTSFFSLSVAKRKQLYRAYMELVCYVPWKDSPEESFLDDVQRSTLDSAQQDPEKDHRYSLRRLEIFWNVYMTMWKRGEVAPSGSQWWRDNQYSYSMFLTTKHNVDVHLQRVEHEGTLSARYETDDEVKDTSHQCAQ